MDSISAIIIDDEPSACDILSKLIERFTEGIDVVGIAHNLEDGAKLIAQTKPSAVFLDIQMPRYSGLEILEFFPDPNFDIVFVTAYDHFALKAFELSAVDYLLKPIDIDKFKPAIDRLKERFKQRQIRQNYYSLKENIRNDFPSHIQLANLDDSKQILLSDVIAFEADESYTHLHLNEGKEMASKNLKHFETLLIDHPDFFRSHKSWLINLKHVEYYSKQKALIRMSNGLDVKLSRLKKGVLASLLKM